MRPPFGSPRGRFFFNRFDWNSRSTGLGIKDNTINMKAKIYRGTKEIGGTCVELTANNGKILWIDLGLPLEDKTPNVDYANNKVDALLISHPHQDHFGLMEKVGIKVPIYIGQLSLDLINATKIFTANAPLNGNYKIVKPWKPFTIADTFKVKAYLTDHSTPESFAFLIEADGKTIFYSGDFRATGRKKVVFEKLIENPPPKIDFLFIEGTMIERTNHEFTTEESIEHRIYEICKKQKNISYVISSAQNVDRFVSVFNACRKANKTLVIDIYSAWVLDMVAKVSVGIPKIEWKEIKVYPEPSQLKKLNDELFNAFKRRIEKQTTDDTVFSSPSEFVYFMRYPKLPLIKKLKRHGIINIIYSQWEGYLKDENNYSTQIINPLRNDKGFIYTHIHTSGHAVVPDLMKFAKAINAKKIIPIHTAFPKKFKTEFEKKGFTNIELWDDGKEYQL